jgi:hypothetical protein
MIFSDTFYTVHGLNTSKSNIYKFLMTILKYEGQIHRIHSFNEKVRLSRVDAIILLNEELKESFEKETGFELTEARKAHLNNS